jgi:hypothetical protein
MAIQERRVARDQTLFTFLAAAARIRDQIATSLERAGVSVAEYESLTRVRAGAWCSVQDVDEDLVQRLVIKGLIRRIRNHATGAGIVRIRHAGRDLLEECEIQIDVVRATLAASFTAAERAALANYVSRIP